MPAIHAQHVTLQTHDRRSGRPPLTLLHDVSVAIYPGELVAMVGPSGAGKSSLLACLAGLDMPTSGTVTLIGTDLAQLSRDRLATHRLTHVSAILQGGDLFSALTCSENVTLPLRLRGRVGATTGRRKRLRAIGADALAEVGLDWAADQLPSALSGGERQRVALARMFSTPADVILADEPTAALDEANASSVRIRLRRRANSGSAVLFITHDLEAAVSADRVVVLSGGRLLADEGGMGLSSLKRWIGGPSSPSSTALS